MTLEHDDANSSTSRKNADKTVSMYSFIMMMSLDQASHGERPTIHIDKANKEDVRSMLHAWKEAWLGAYSNERSNISKADIEQHLTDQWGPGREEQMLAWIENTEGSYATFVARHKGYAIGFVVAKKSDGANQICALYVEPEFQHKGVATHLMREAFSYLGSEKDIEVAVKHDNPEAIRFYKFFGFGDTGKFPKEASIRLSNGKTIPQILLIKPGKKRNDVPVGTQHELPL